MAETYIDRSGYRRFSDSGILVHRWVAEDKLKRRLRKGEVVHHINGNKLDNRPENLQVFKNQELHHAFHQKSIKDFGGVMT